MYVPDVTTVIGEAAVFRDLDAGHAPRPEHSDIIRSAGAAGLLMRFSRPSMVGVALHALHHVPRPASPGAVITPAMHCMAHACLPACLSVCLSVCLSACLPVSVCSMNTSQHRCQISEQVCAKGSLGSGIMRCVLWYALSKMFKLVYIAGQRT